VLLDIPLRFLGLGAVDYRWLLRNTSLLLALAVGMWRVVRGGRDRQNAANAEAAVERIEKQLRVRGPASRFISLDRGKGWLIVWS
jgi:hypothetical protein